MKTMKAVGLYHSLPIDNPESLVDLEVEKPTAVGRDLLVKVMANSVNYVDTMMRWNHNPSENDHKILGWDVAGVVEEVGADCTLFQPGDEVYYAGSLMRQGANAEYHLVDERIVGRKPQILNFAEAAALPLTSITAMEALYERMRISREKQQNEGKTMLIIGAAGGAGSIATQLAKFAGLTVIGTASRPLSEEWVKASGADYVINHYNDFASQLRAFDIESADYIFCLNSTHSHWEQMAEVIAPQGTICSIVETGQPVILDALFYKSVKFVWELMFTRSMYQTPDMMEQHNILNHVAELVDAGILKTTIHETYSPINADNLRKAHAQLESKSSIGKIVLEGF